MLNLSFRSPGYECFIVHICWQNPWLAVAILKYQMTYIRGAHDKGRHDSFCPIETCYKDMMIEFNLFQCGTIGLLTFE